MNKKEEINIYIKKIKPKYFNSKEIDELKSLLKDTNEYINNLEYENDKYIFNYKEIDKENKLLKTKIDTIKHNLEKNNNIKDIIIYLENLKNDENIIARFFLKIILSLLYIVFYFLLNKNNKKILKLK